MWLKSTSNFKEQTRITLKLTIEKFDVVKKEQVWANHANFSPYRYEVKKKIYSNEELQNQSIRGQITFGIQLQTFAWNCNTKNFNLKPDPQMKKKLILIKDATSFTHTMK